VFGAPPKRARKYLPHPSLQAGEAGYHYVFQLKVHFKGNACLSAQPIRLLSRFENRGRFAAWYW